MTKCKYCGKPNEGAASCESCGAPEVKPITNETKLCKDCQHCMLIGGIASYCYAPQLGINLLDGTQKYLRLDRCREDSHQCSVSGLWWVKRAEPERATEPPPKPTPLMQEFRESPMADSIGWFIIMALMSAIMYVVSR